jgi:SLBB domain
MKILFCSLSILFLFSYLPSGNIIAQNEDFQLGGAKDQLRQAQGAYYDYSDPEAVNIKVSVWGYVKFPGRYIIPNYSSALDLLSYAGGPTLEADLDNLNIYRMKKDSTQEMIKFNYNALLYDDSLSTIKQAPQIKAGDVILIPGSPRLFFKDYFSISLSVFSALVSLAILVLNIARK